MLHGVIARLRALCRHDRVDREIDEELQFHLNARIDQLVAGGMDAGDARVAALREVGNISSIKERSVDALGVRYIQDGLRDARYGVRTLIKSPMSTAIIIATLAVGIGGNSAIFGLMDALAFRKLPVPDPDRLVFLDVDSMITHRQFLRLRDQSRHFDHLAAVWTVDRSNVTTDSPSGHVEEGVTRIGLASAEYFETLRLQPAIGRAFTEADDNPQSQPVVVISDAFNRRRFGGSSDVLKRLIYLNGTRYDIVGVAPPGFSGEWIGMPTDLWVPFAMASRVMPEIPGGPDRFPRRVLGRLKDDARIDEAEAATRVMYARLLTDEKDSSRPNIRLSSGARGYSPQRQAFAQPLAIVAAGVAVLLLIACANLANLLLARAAGRQREIAVRLAIGATRGRLVRQMLTETLILAACGGILGVLLATWSEAALTSMVAISPAALSGGGNGLYLELGIDRRTLAFTGVLCLLTGFLFGLAPAFSTRRVAVASSLTRTSGRLVGLKRFGPSTLLVSSQVALSLLLLVGAGLFTRTLANLKSQPLGFERDHTLMIWAVPGQTGRQDDAMAALWRQVQERLLSLPGVTAAGASNQPVLRGEDLEPSGNPVVSLRVDGEEPRTSATPGLRSFVTPGFFGALGVPLLKGRDFTEADTEKSQRVVILNEAMARHYFGDRSPIGRTVRFPGREKTPTEIVGVVADFAKGTPRGGVHAEFATYFPYRDVEALNHGAQSRLRVMLVIVRTVADPLTLGTRVRDELRAIDPSLPILRINSVDQHLDDVLAQDRLIAGLSAVFSIVAVFMACLGLFGVISHRVTRRASEIGVRLALGATRVDIFRMVIAESGRLVGAGLVVGLAAALLLARFVSSRLYGVSPADPLTIVAAAVLLSAVAAVAALIPARRAAAIDPIGAIRAE